MDTSNIKSHHLFPTLLIISDVAPKSNPFRQGKKGEKNVPVKTAMVAHNADGNGNFVKLTYMPSGYLEATRYLATQPLASRKKGFGSKDAFKTDEFSNAIRTSQYREGIIKEAQRAKENGSLERTKQMLEAYEAEEIANPKPAWKGKDYSASIAQFDIGRSRVTEFDAKSSKDTFYKFDEHNGKRYGMYKPVSVEVGANAWTHKYAPPANGGKSEVQKFFDKSHLTTLRL
jgi:hypothetical protein